MQKQQLAAIVKPGARVQILFLLNWVRGRGGGVNVHSSAVLSSFSQLMGILTAKNRAGHQCPERYLPLEVAQCHPCQSVAICRLAIMRSRDLQG